MTQFLIYLLLILGGLFAGFVNTLAGNGSLVTLTLLMEFIGLPPLVANGTNRVGIFFHSIVTSWTMARHQTLEKYHTNRILPILMIGGVLGGILSVMVSPEQFRSVYKFLLVILFVTLLVNPKKWLDPSRISTVVPWPIKYLILFIVGIYGGFIQMGMGIILLAVLVLIEKIDIIKANAIKLIAVFLYSPIVFGIVIYSGLVNWKFGLVLAAGQVTGGYITAKYISKWKHANVLAYGLLIVMVVSAMIKIFLF